MNIINKVHLLKLAFAGLEHQRKEANQLFTDAIYEFEDEIGDYFKLHLPEVNQIYGNGIIVELKEITEEIFKDPNSPKKKELQECLGRLSIAAHFIPKEKQDVD